MLNSQEKLAITWVSQINWVLIIVYEDKITTELNFLGLCSVDDPF